MFCARVDLPTPLGPTTTILAASLRKSSAISASLAALGPVPVEVAQRLEAADMSGLQPPFQAAAGALLLFPIEQRRDPGLGRDLRPVRHQAVQMQRLGAGAQGVEFSHRNAP